MNKQKFEAYLRDKLSILKEEEIDEIVAEYLQHIDMRVAEGVSEEEAIGDFGDLDELVNDLLDAYKINRNDRDFEKIEHRVKLTLNNIMDFINRIASSIMKRSSNEVVTLIVEFIIVIFAVFLINSFVEAIFNGFNSAFYFRPYFLTNLIRLIIGLLRIAVTTSVSLAIFYWFAKERVLRNEDVKEEDDTFASTSQNAQQETVKPDENHKDSKMPNEAQKDVKEERLNQEVSSSASFTMNDAAVLKDSNIIDATVEREQVIEPEQQKIKKDVNHKSKKASSIPKPKKEKSFGQKVLTFNINIIRFIVALCLIPAIVIGVFMGIGYVIILVATFSGYGSIGLSLILTGINLIYYYVLIMFIKFVGGKRA